jgi:hypothetical protein
MGSRPARRDRDGEALPRPAILFADECRRQGRGDIILQHFHLFADKWLLED